MAAQVLLQESGRGAVAAKQDLVTAELILGVLRSKDASGRGVIHSSDFQRAVGDLGFPLGAPVIQDMLVHCKLDQMGNIDFSPLERELQSRRRALSEMPKPTPVPPATSLAASSEDVWRADKEHQKRINIERQAKLVKECRQDLLQVFKRFSHGTDRSYGAEQVVADLEQMGLECTRAMRLLLEERKGEKDVNFVTFCSVLTRTDPSEQSLDDIDYGAGKSTQAQSQMAETNFLQDSDRRPLRRADYASRSRMQERSDAEAMVAVVAGKAKASIMNDTRGYADAALYKNSKQVFSSLQPQQTEPQLSMLTHNQEQMFSGVKGGTPVICYNSEIKLQREQVLAAMRKLDSHEISLDEFQSKALAIGFDIPHNVMRMLQEATVVGRFDWRKIIRILDTSVFKAKALEAAPDASAVEAAKEIILAHLSEQDGATALVNLETAFHNFDTDGNNALSFNEFKAAMASYRQLADVPNLDLRALFHTLDKNGDGSLSIDEFIDLLRPPVPNSRRVHIRNAFTKLDRFNARAVAIDDVIDGFSPEFHVDVVSGRKTGRQVVTEMVNAFDVIGGGGGRGGDGDSGDASAAGMVSFDKFSAYFSSLSACVESDDDFVAMVKGCWGLGDKSPAPFVGVQNERRGRQLNTSNSVTPVDRQSYGDIISWNQEESEHEARTRKTPRDVSLLASMKARDSDVIRWTKVGAGNERPGGVGGEGFRALTGTRQERLNAAQISSNVHGHIKAWAKPSRDAGSSSASAPAQAQPQPQPQAYPGQPLAAGSSTVDRHRLRDGDGVRHATEGGKFTAMQRKNFGGPTPFGVTYEVSCAVLCCCRCVALLLILIHSHSLTYSLSLLHPTNRPHPTCTRRSLAARAEPQCEARAAACPTRPRRCTHCSRRGPTSPRAWPTSWRRGRGVDSVAVRHKLCRAECIHRVKRSECEVCSLV